MKSFSKEWKSSKSLKKQRKYLRNSPLHIKGKFLDSPLSEELIKKYNIKKIRIRKGDKVKVLRGDFKGKVGKVTKVDIKKNRIYIEGIEQKKADGSISYFPIHPSKVMILELNLEDKRRIKEKK